MSTSVSLAIILILVKSASSSIVAASSTATGASLTKVIFNLTDTGALLALPSWAINLKLSELFVSDLLLYFNEFPLNSLGRTFLSIQFPSINKDPESESNSVIKYFNASGPLSTSVALNVISSSVFSATVFSSLLATGISWESNNLKTLT